MKAIIYCESKNNCNNCNKCNNCNNCNNSTFVKVEGEENKWTFSCGKELSQKPNTG